MIYTYLCVRAKPKSINEHRPVANSFYWSSRCERGGQVSLGDSLSIEEFRRWSLRHQVRMVEEMAKSEFLFKDYQGKTANIIETGKSTRQIMLLNFFDIIDIYSNLKICSYSDSTRHGSLAARRLVVGGVDVSRPRFGRLSFRQRFEQIRLAVNP